MIRKSTTANSASPSNQDRNSDSISVPPRPDKKYADSKQRNRREKSAAARSLAYESLEVRNLLAPVVGNDVYDVTGNTTVELSPVDSFTHDVSIKLEGSLFDNDEAGVTLDSFEATGSLGGEIAIDGSGGFVYFPPVGETETTETFTYTVTDGVDTSTGNIEFNLTDQVWYVDWNRTEAGLGTSESPFRSFVPLDANSVDADQEGDTIYVIGGSGTLTTAFQLEDNQRLIGAGEGLEIDGRTIATPGEYPGIGFDGPNAITLGNGNELKGISVEGTEQSIYGLNVQSVLIDNVQVSSSEFGIYVRSFLNTLVSDVTITDSTVEATNGRGIYIYGNAGITTEITGSSVDSVNGAGIYVYSNGDLAAEITDSTFETENGDGIYVQSYGDLTTKISGNTVRNSENGISVRVRENTDVLIANNKIVDSHDRGIWVTGTQNEADKSFQLEIVDNEITSNQRTFGIYADIFSSDDVSIAVNVQNNRIELTHENHGRSGVGVSGFHFTDLSILNNEILGEDARISIGKSHFDNVVVDELNLSDMALGLNSLTGNLSINSVSIQNSSKHLGLSVSGLWNERFTFSANELNIDNTQVESAEGDVSFWTRYTDLHIGEGEIVGANRAFFALDSHLDVNLDKVIYDGPSTSGQNGLHLKNVDGEFTVRGGLQVGNNDVIINLDPDAVVELQGPVRAGTFQIIAESGAQVSVHGPVGIEQLEISGGHSIFDDFVTIAHGGLARLETGRWDVGNTTIAEFRGGVSVIGPKVQFRTSDTQLAILGENNVIEATSQGQFEPHLNVNVVDTVILDGGVQLEKIFGVGPVNLDLYRPESGGHGSFVVTGESHFPMLSIATEVDVLLMDPNSTIGRRSVLFQEMDWAVLGQTVNQDQPGRLEFHGVINDTFVQFGNLFDIQSTHEMTYDFFGEIVTNEDDGIVVVGHDSEINFHGPVTMGSPEDAGLGILDLKPDGLSSVNFFNTVTVFHDLVRHLENGPAILVEGEDANLHIDHLVASTSDGDLIQAENFGSLSIGGGELTAFSGQPVSIGGGHIEVTLNSVSAGAGDDPAVHVFDTTGFFHVVGNAIGEGSSPDFSGGTIVGRSGDALAFRNAENVELDRMYIANSGNAGIEATDVNNLQLTRSRLVGNGASQDDAGFAIENATGQWLISGVIFRNANGARNVSVINRGESVLDQFAVRGSRFSGSGASERDNFFIAAYGNSQVDVDVELNEFRSFDGNHLTVRSNGQAKVDLVIANNLLAQFNRGVLVQQRGGSQMTFDVRQNDIVGHEDGSSSYGIVANGIANSHGEGQINGTIRNHRGSLGRISRTEGVRLSVTGYENEGTTYASHGNFHVRNNAFMEYSGFAGLNVSARGAGSQLVFRADLNAFLRPATGNVAGIRVVSGVGNSDGQVVQVSIHDNISQAGSGRSSAAYQLVQKGDSEMKLTAPAGNSEIGQSFVNSDGGVLSSVGPTGNNNTTRLGDDVFALGVIEIIEDIF